MEGMNRLIVEKGDEMANQGVGNITGSVNFVRDLVSTLVDEKRNACFENKEINAELFSHMWRASAKTSSL